MNRLHPSQGLTPRAVRQIEPGKPATRRRTIALEEFKFATYLARIVRGSAGHRRRSGSWPGLFLCLVMSVAALASGCHQSANSNSAPSSTPQPSQTSSPKFEFELVATQFHDAAAEKSGPERDLLLARAEEGYQNFLKKYPIDRLWSPQALNHLAAVQGLRGKVDPAIATYREVETRFPQQIWERLQSWKAAGDLLWEAGRKGEAGEFYRRIIDQHGGTNEPAVVALVVKGARGRL